MKSGQKHKWTASPALATDASAIFYFSGNYYSWDHEVKLLTSLYVHFLAVMNASTPRQSYMSSA